MTIWRCFLLAAAMMLAPAAPVAAQGPFEPVIRVGDQIVTRYELDQRTLFLTLLNAGPNPAELARQQLVNERLQLGAAATEGVTVPEEAVIAAQTDFAARGEFSREDFVAALAEQGVEEGTFRNFVAAGLAWRDTVRTRFGRRAAVTEAELDRALAGVPAQSGTRVLLSEIILPAGDPATEAASRRRAERVAALTDEAEFAQAARLFSISPSRFEGGEIDWRAAEELPPEVAAAVVGLQPGQVTRPLAFGQTIGVFRLRDREDVPQGSLEIVSADYAELLIPGGRSPEALSRAARIAAEARTCDDLYGLARDLPAERLRRQTVRLDALPADVAREIAALDAGEASTGLTRGGDLVLLMLCQRTRRESGAVDRNRARQFLTNQRLATFAAGYINELRFAAEIEELR